MDNQGFRQKKHNFILTDNLHIYVLWVNMKKNHLFEDAGLISRHSIFEIFKKET